ncbi:MAG: condensation domain-containing protein, partial [Chryseobacterium sp.]|uniref:condensation domain-containing protein n=1 Tax=Chryseobacterium sp. TaxID=1871047 RepID=UPI00281924ED
MEDFLLKLTPYQTIFYNEWMLSPSRIDYNIVFDQSMSGAIDISRLNSSLVRFMNNHLLLNSNVINKSGNLFWKHRPLLSADTQILTVFSEDPGPEEIFKLALQPFDLEKDPLARFYAIKLSNGGYRTIHIFHHIIIDGLSADSVYAELGVYYNDQDYVNPINLTEQKNLNEKLSDQFEKILAKGKTEMSDFWKNSLQEVENVGFKFLEHSEPFHSKAGKREPLLSNPVSEARFSFSESVFLQVKELISKYKLTPYTYGQMVLAVLLHKISGINNLVINCPIGITEGQNFIFGANINTILKEYRFNKESSLQDLIDQNIEYTRQLKKSKGRYFPIEELVNYVPSNLLEFRFVQTNLKDVIIPYEGAGEVTINTELHVDLVGKLSFDQEVRDGVLNYKVRYSNQEFNAELVSGLAEMYERLFIDMLGDLLDENTHHLITDYELLDEKAYQHVMHYGNGIEANSPEDKTIHELFEAQVERTPDRTALVFNDVQLTYR